MRLRLAAATLSAAVFTALPAAAHAATVNVFPAKGCYRAGEALQIGGTGYTLNGPVRITSEGAPIGTLNADATGVFRGKLTVGQTKGARTKTYTATDVTDPTLGASIPLQVTAVSANVVTKAVLPGAPVRVKARGFTTGRTLYAHVLSGRSHRNVRVGRLKGPCGSLSTRRKVFTRRTRSGRYVVQFDTRRAYSRRTAVKSIKRYRVVLAPRARP